MKIIFVIDQMCFVSFGCLFLVHHQDYKTGSIIRTTNEDRVKDEYFFRLKEEKSTEGLSESIVQLANQMCFMVFFIFMCQIEVSYKSRNAI